MKKLLLLLLCLTFISCTKITVEWELLSLKRENATEGSFFLGSGSIGTEMYYIAYVKHRKDKKIYLKAFNAARTAIYEDGGSSPWARFNITTTSDPINYYPQAYGSKIGPCDCTNIELHVPQNTILRHFRLE